MKLNEYMQKYCVNRLGFSRKNNIPPGTVYNAMIGLPIKLITAAKISIATENNVKMTDMLTDDEKKELQAWRAELGI